VTITLPTHPLRGVQLPVIRTARSQDGRRYIDVEHPPGWCMRLPIEWTDRSSPLVPPSIGGREVRLGISALLKLADAVEVALRQEHALPPASGSAAGVRQTRGTGRAPDRGRGKRLKILQKPLSTILERSRRKSPVAGSIPAGLPRVRRTCTEWQTIARGLSSLAFT
jgi:hypothetical protein